MIVGCLQLTQSCSNRRISFFGYSRSHPRHVQSSRNPTFKKHEPLVCLLRSQEAALSRQGIPSISNMLRRHPYRPLSIQITKRIRLCRYGKQIPWIKRYQNDLRNIFDLYEASLGRTEWEVWRFSAKRLRCSHLSRPVTLLLYKVVYY